MKQQVKIMKNKNPLLSKTNIGLFIALLAGIFEWKQEMVLELEQLIEEIFILAGIAFGFYGRWVAKTNMSFKKN